MFYAYRLLKRMTPTMKKIALHASMMNIVTNTVLTASPFMDCIKPRIAQPWGTRSETISPRPPPGVAQTLNFPGNRGMRRGNILAVSRNPTPETPGEHSRNRDEP